MTPLFGSSNLRLCIHSCRCSPFLYQGFRTQYYLRTESRLFLRNAHLCPENRSEESLFQWCWPFSSTWQVSGSVLSVYSGDFGSVDAQGTVEFALDYDEKNREFQVHVSQCKDLAVVDEKKDRTDPWVMLHFGSSWLLCCWILCSEELSFFLLNFLVKCHRFFLLLVHVYW